MARDQKGSLQVLIADIKATRAEKTEHRLQVAAYARMLGMAAKVDGIAISEIKGTVLIKKDDGTYPNNERLPLLVYQGALDLSEGNPAGTIEDLFAANEWGGSWRNVIYGCLHYHSTAHEVLGVYSGNARVQFGGEYGVTLSVSPGDVVVIPAGVAHKNLGASLDFRVVGAYPRGQAWDINYGNADERPRADQNTAHVPLPGSDPVYGAEGPLFDHWTE